MISRSWEEIVPAPLPSCLSSSSLCFPLDESSVWQEISCAVYMDGKTLILKILVTQKGSRDVKFN